MNSQQFKAHSLAAEAKRKGALEAKLCWQGTALAVHIIEPDRSARSEIVYPCGCVEQEIHRPAEASAAIQSNIVQHT